MSEINELTSNKCSRANANRRSIFLADKSGILINFCLFVPCFFIYLYTADLEGARLSGPGGMKIPSGSAPKPKTSNTGLFDQIRKSVCQLIFKLKMVDFL